MEIQQAYQNNVHEIPKTIFTFIKDFIENKELNSKNTALNYEKDIRQFFLIVKHKNIEHLTEVDLKLKLEDVENYKKMLLKNKDKRFYDGKPYSPASVKRMLSSVRNLYSKLEANDYEVKSAWFNVDKIKGESKSHGLIELHQAEQMVELVKKEQKGDIKSVLIETAYKTAFRESSLLKLTWDNLKYEDNTWVLVADDNAVGKGKKVSEKSISNDLYEKLMTLKEKYGNQTNRIFPLTRKTAILMMQRLRKEMGLGKDITFHSLKQCGISEAYDASGGDIMAIAEFGDHSSPNTTMKHYLKRKKKPSQRISLLIGSKVNINPLKELSKEELIKVIEMSSRSVQFELLNNSKNLNN